MNIKIKYPKEVTILSICISLFATALAIFVLHPESSHYNLRYGKDLLSSGIILLVVGITWNGMTLIADHNGISLVCYSITIKKFIWCECVYIGMYIRKPQITVNRKSDGQKYFACATTPMKCREKGVDEISARLGSPQVILGKPNWKLKEALDVRYDFIGDENYRKILELCGGERNVRETNLD